MGASFVKVQPVLPGEADRAGQLEEVVQDVHGVTGNGCFGEQRSAQGAGGREVVGGGAQQQAEAADPHGVVDQSVLDRLEPADGLPEGQAIACVDDGALERPFEPAERVGGEQQVSDREGEPDGVRIADDLRAARGVESDIDEGSAHVEAARARCS